MEAGEEVAQEIDDEDDSDHPHHDDAHSLEGEGCEGREGVGLHPPHPFVHAVSEFGGGSEVDLHSGED